jgi:hypothetical protein
MTSLPKVWEKIKGFRNLTPPLPILPDDLFLSLVIILVAFGSFGLGRLSKIEGAKTPIQIENAPQISSETFSGKISADSVGVSPQIPDANNQSADLVGSKNGTKYYYSWCTGVKNIAPANLIHFASKADAEARGYTPSSTCKGL